eukprot:7037037-Prymnesium_polylepis.2
MASFGPLGARHPGGVLVGNRAAILYIRASARVEPTRWCRLRLRALGHWDSQHSLHRRRSSRILLGFKSMTFAFWGYVPDIPIELEHSFGCG